MKKYEPIITNNLDEKLDTWVEVPIGNVKATVVMVHGFGTSKHETAGYFDDISLSLTDDNFRVVRFDLSGYGNSEGLEEDACYSKHILDLKSVLDWVKTSFDSRVYIFAQSMGCWVTALANPNGITKTIMTGVPNSNPEIIVKRVKERFGSRPGAVLNLDGISLLPRSTGKIRYIQNRFSLLNQSINPELQKYMIENNIKLVPYQVIDSGQLTETVLKGAERLVGGDLRIGRSDWLPEQVNVIQDWTKSDLLPIAEKLGISLVQLSIAWALHQQYMGFVIVGNTNPKYTDINLKSDHIKLDESVLNEIDQVYKKLESTIQEKYGQSIREFRGLNEKYY